MSNIAHLWARFTIRAYRDPAAADAQRIVFELADPVARASAGRPATVVLQADGDLLVRYEPPKTGVPGLGRVEYVQKAAEVAKATAARKS